MTPSSRPGALQIAFALTVVTAIGGGVGWNAASREVERRAVRENALTAELSAANALLQSARQELEASREAADLVMQDLERQISELSQARDSLNARLDENANEPLVVPNGEIRWIDPVGKKVWINLGEADGMKARETFDVYNKASSRVDNGQVKVIVGKQHIQGQIEVTRVLESHLSEAHIVNENINHPIAKGDFIYSPLWRQEQGIAISTVGIVDLDNDGVPDIARFRKLIAAAGISIDNEVDEEGALFVNGKRAPDNQPQVTDRTKFIVIGAIPEIKEGDDPKTADRIQKVLERRRNLEAVARERGIRIISLEDFLRYIRYKPQKRLFIPGGDVPWKLKARSERAAVE